MEQNDHILLRAQKKEARRRRRAGVPMPVPPEIRMEAKRMMPGDERRLTDETWEIALRCAVAQYESYVRQGKVSTSEERREALSDALQHAVGIILLRESRE